MNDIRDIIFPPFFNGDGTDGAVRLQNTNTLTSSKMYKSVHALAGSILFVSGHRLYVSGLLTIDAGAAIHANGISANLSTIGTGTPSAELGGGGDGGSSRDGITAGTAGLDSLSSASLGGAGGTSITAGGQAVFTASFGLQNMWLRNFQAMYSGLLYYPSTAQVVSGGGGGGAGDYAGGGSGNRGGSGGGGGGVLWIAADTIWLRPYSILTANGGNGGNATAGALLSSGGSGGGGGAVILFCNRFINEGATIQANGGTGGTGVNGGSSGGQGANGKVVIFTPLGIIVA